MDIHPHPCLQTYNTSRRVVENVKLACVPLVSIQACPEPTRFPISLWSWQTSIKPYFSLILEQQQQQKKPSKSLTVLQYGLGRYMLEKTRHQQGLAISPHVLCCSGFCCAGCNLPGQACPELLFLCLQTALRSLHLLCRSQGR